MGVVFLTPSALPLAQIVPRLAHLVIPCFYPLAPVVLHVALLAFHRAFLRALSLLLLRGPSLVPPLARRRRSLRAFHHALLPWSCRVCLRPRPSRSLLWRSRPLRLFLMLPLLVTLSLPRPVPLVLRDACSTGFLPGGTRRPSRRVKWRVQRRISALSGAATWRWLVSSYRFRWVARPHMVMEVKMGERVRSARATRLRSFRVCVWGFLGSHNVCNHIASQMEAVIFF